jgi:hypothetical protein
VVTRARIGRSALILDLGHRRDRNRTTAETAKAVARIWTCASTWRLEAGPVFVCGWRDHRKLERTGALGVLEGRELLAVQATPSLLEATFVFDGEVRLHLALVTTEAYLAWAVGLPGGQIGVADQGRWEVRRAVARDWLDPDPPPLDPSWEERLDELWREHQSQPGQPATSQDLTAIQTMVAPLLGHAPWSALRHGSAVELLWEDASGTEWSLWPTCSWQLLAGDQVLVGSEDSDERLDEELASLAGVPLVQVELVPPTLLTTWVFDRGYRLRLFPGRTYDSPHWELYTGDSGLLKVGPGSRWSFHPKPS